MGSLLVMKDTFIRFTKQLKFHEIQNTILYHIIKAFSYCKYNMIELFLCFWNWNRHFISNTILSNFSDRKMSSLLIPRERFSNRRNIDQFAHLNIAGTHAKKTNSLMKPSFEFEIWKFLSRIQTMRWISSSLTCILFKSLSLR